MGKRLPFIAGNWKMNLTAAEVKTLLSALAPEVEKISTVEVAVFPPAPYLLTAVAAVGNSPIQVGAQNMCWEEAGAFTGEISSAMLLDIGCNQVLVGHSERRHIFQENDEIINRKLRHGLEASLTVVLCLGETLEEREREQTNQVVMTQLRAGLKQVGVEDLSRILIAYEPVWAIGTGKTATPAQAQDVHESIRGWLAEDYGRETAESIRILYGGSVKPQNAAELLSQPDIDGALVGGASLKADSFLAIIRSGA